MEEFCVGVGVGSVGGGDGKFRGRGRDLVDSQRKCSVEEFIMRSTDRGRYISRYNGRYSYRDGYRYDDRDDSKDGGDYWRGWYKKDRYYSHRTRGSC